MSLCGRFSFSALFMTVAFAAAMPLVQACDTEVDGACVKGEACVCEDDCSEDCDGAGCGFTCEAGADCDFACPEGGCAVVCGDGTQCDLDCPGGNCQMTCAADASCNVSDCAGGSCVLTCDPSSATCENACGLEQGCVTA